jgi:hypothetical protein
MRTGRAALKQVIDSVAEGSGNLDWGAIEAQLDDERDQALLEQLRILAKISDVQRRGAEGLDELELESRAKVIASILPIDERARRGGVEIGPSRPRPGQAVSVPRSCCVL